VNALTPISPEHLAELTGDHRAILPFRTVAEIVAQRDREIDAAKARFWQRERGLKGFLRDKLRQQCSAEIEDAERRYLRAMRINLKASAGHYRRRAR
jgi:hypothetical protein